MTTADISEAASENPPKTKRGRPPVLDPQQVARLRGFFPDIRTVRGLQGRANALRAMNVLDHAPAFNWLCSTKEAVSAGQGKLRFTILSELGRVEDDDLKALARQLCQERPRSKDAVAMIRRWRTGKAPTGGAIDLAFHLTRCADEYAARHPGTTRKMLLAALENAAYLLDNDDAGEDAE
jgi:hypothetical protein